MILIADSGSTKTDWKATDGLGRIVTARTGGLNPYYLDPEEINEIIGEASKQLQSNEFLTVCFYGAGCSAMVKKEKIHDGLRAYFPDSDIHVENDLLGAARALCQSEPGIVCILGTGSGSCVYDGNGISRSIPSLGFILGDEGSGAHMGKMLVRDYLREEMPAGLIKEIHNDLGISKEIILESVNRKLMPSRYLAGFARFIHDHLGNDYIEKLVYESLNDFIDRYVIRYEESGVSAIHFIGSIAMNFRKVLRNVLEDHGLRIGKVEDSPVQGLIEYHLNKNY